MDKPTGSFKEQYTKSIESFAETERVGHDVNKPDNLHVFNVNCDNNPKVIIWKYIGCKITLLGKQSNKKGI